MATICTLSRAMNCAEMQAQLVVGVGGDVVKLVHGDQPVVECLDAELVHGEAEGRMGADQHLVVAFQERPDRIDLAAIVRARRIAEVPFRLDLSSRPRSRTWSAAHHGSSRRWLSPARR